MDRLSWLLAPDLGREKLALLVFCTWTLYVLAVNLAWRWFRGKASRSLVARVGGGALGLVYGVGIPLAVLWRGVGMREMGIPTTWVAQHGDVWRWLGIDAGQAIALLPQVAFAWLIGVGLFTAVWVWYVRTVGDMPVQSPTPWWQALLSAFSLQMLWALYRCFASTLTTNAAYASFIALALVAASWLLDPFRRHGLTSRPDHTHVVRDWMLLLLTGFAAIQVRSLWLLVGLHWTWLWVSDRALEFVGLKYALPAAS
ncbi:MAG: hypothetical protein JW934_16210 [Anaerolineae bacterium]|nr:hypothetical protein [Anaerolineae bacterium]